MFFFSWYQLYRTNKFVRPIELISICSIFIIRTLTTEVSNTDVVPESHRIHIYCTVLVDSLLGWNSMDLLAYFALVKRLRYFWHIVAPAPTFFRSACFLPSLTPPNSLFSTRQPPEQERHRPIPQRRYILSECHILQIRLGELERHVFAGQLLVHGAEGVRLETQKNRTNAVRRERQSQDHCPTDKSEKSGIQSTFHKIVALNLGVKQIPNRNNTMNQKMQ